MERLLTSTLRDAFPTMAFDMQPDGAEPTITTRVVNSPETNPLHLRRGDRVAINRGSVNGRAWMSTLAPVNAILKGGTEGVLLSEAVRSEERRWVKFRPMDTDAHYYVAARYCELIQPGERTASSTQAEPEGLPELWSVSQPGDLVTAQIDIDIRSEPGFSSPISDRMKENALATVLDVPRFVDGTGWLPIEHAAGAGWAELEWMIPLVRSGKWIEVDIQAQTLIVREDGTEISRALISSGKPGYPTPAGAFAITHKFPIRHMKASVRGEQWDYPAVPWAMRFRAGGFYLHSCFWNDEFGSAVSHGCVNMPVPFAEWLYEWAPVGTPVWIHR
jgi:hypothetical protein